MRSRSNSLLVLIGLLSCSCSRDDGVAEGHSFQVFLEDGVEVAETSGGPRYEDDLFIYEEVAQIQENESEPKSLLIRPNWIFRDEDGNHYLADFGDDRIAVFDAAGRYLTSIGREGDGPGEFRSPRIQFVRDGLLSVWDGRKRVEVRFRTDGSYIETHRPPFGFEARIGRGSQVPLSYQALPDGRFLLIRSLDSYSEEGRFASVEAYVLDSSDEVVSQYGSREIRTGYRGANGRQYSFSPAIQPTIAYHPAQGICLTVGDKPVIRIVGLDGSLQRLIRLREDPLPYPEQTKDWERDWLREDIEQQEGNMRQELQQHLDNMQFPEFQPFWTSLMVDDYGYFWVLTPGVSLGRYELQEGLYYRIFNPEGEYLGVTLSPPVWYASVCHGHFVSTYYNGEAGRYELVSYRIVPAVAGLKYPGG